MKKILIHRVWQVGTGRMRPEKAHDFINEFKQRVHEQSTAKLAELLNEGIVFYDIFVPAMGANGSDVAVTIVRSDDTKVQSDSRGSLQYLAEDTK